MPSAIPGGNGGNPPPGSVSFSDPAHQAPADRQKNKRMERDPECTRWPKATSGSTAAQKSSPYENLVYGDAGNIGIEKREKFQDYDAEFRVAIKPGQRRFLTGIR